jgi:hypothetical protein
MAAPPLRLLLGSDAVQAAEQSALARIEADKKWRELSASTDFKANGTRKKVAIRVPECPE